MIKRFFSAIRGFFAKKIRLNFFWRVFLWLALSGCILLFCVALQPGAVRKTLSNFLHEPRLLMLNLLPVLVLTGLLSALFGNVFFGASLSSVILELMSLANLIKMECRRDPLIPEDFGLLSEAMVATGDYQLNLHLPYAAVILIFAVLLLLAGIKCKGRGRIWERVLVVLAAAGVFVGAMCTVYPSPELYRDVISTVEGLTYTNVPAVFNETGFLYCFLHNYKLNSVQKPAGYSEAEAAAWAAETTLTPPEGGALPVHVIFVQCEAFSDIYAADVFDYGPEDDPLGPYWEVIGSDQALSGHVVVSNFGAGTANTEFDVMTGVQTTKLNEIPASAFRVVHKNTSSIARTYQSQGWQAWFMHPGDRWFYNRESVYNFLGIHDQTFVDAFTHAKWKGSRVSDESFGDMLIEHYEAHVASSDSPWFAFTVTIQNHQAYPWVKYKERPPEAKLRIEVSDAAMENLSVYAQGIRDSSILLKDLTEYFDSREEPVLLIFWGDHLPTLGANYASYREIGLPIGEEDEIASAIQTYTTPFVIWGNRTYCERYDFAARTAALDMTANGYISDIYLGELVYEMTGMQGTDAYFDYLAQARRILPVLCKGRYVLPDGTMTETLTPEQQAVEEKLHRWGYYRIIDERVKD